MESDDTQQGDPGLDAALARAIRTLIASVTEQDQQASPSGRLAGREFDTGHSSGQLRNGDGPYVFIAEVPADQEPGLRVVLRAPDSGAFRPGSPVEVVSPFEPTHYGTTEMTVRDPDGRQWTVQAPAQQ